MDAAPEKLQHQLDKLDTDRLRQKLDLSHFGINAVIRGIQLTLVGGACRPRLVMASSRARSHHAGRH